MHEQLQQRLTELQQEYQKGQQRIQELDQERQNLHETMLRISGAMQVIMELLEAQNGRSAEPAPAAKPAKTKA